MIYPQLHFTGQVWRLPTALSFKKVLCFRKACYFIAVEVLMGKGDFRIHFPDFQ